jgi:hypothetical protein
MGFQSVGETIVDRFAVGELSEIYYGGLAEGRLLIPHCLGCGRHFFFPRRWCPHCWSDRVEWVESPGIGRVFAVSELHTAFQGVSREELPVWIALVELEEDVRLPGRLARAGGPWSVGDQVRLQFAEDPATTLPQFVRIT